MKLISDFVCTQIYEKKEQLARSTILISNLEAKNQIKEVIKVLKAWDWQVSGGAGFFIVDRSLLSGVK